MEKLLDENKQQHALYSQLQEDFKSYFSTTENYKHAMKLIRSSKSAELPEPYNEHLLRLRELSDQDMSVVVRGALQAMSTIARNSVLNASLREDVSNKDVEAIKAAMESLLSRHIASPGRLLYVLPPHNTNYHRKGIQL